MTPSAQQAVASANSSVGLAAVGLMLVVLTVGWAGFVYFLRRSRNETRRTTASPRPAAPTEASSASAKPADTADTIALHRPTADEEQVVAPRVVPLGQASPTRGVTASLSQTPTPMPVPVPDLEQTPNEAPVPDEAPILAEAGAEPGSEAEAEPEAEPEPEPEAEPRSEAEAEPEAEAEFEPAAAAEPGSEAEIEPEATVEPESESESESESATEPEAAAESEGQTDTVPQPVAAANLIEILLPESEDTAARPAPEPEPEPTPSGASASASPAPAPTAGGPASAPHPPAARRKRRSVAVAGVVAVPVLVAIPVIAGLSTSGNKSAQTALDHPAANVSSSAPGVGAPSYGAFGPATDGPTDIVLPSSSSQGSRPKPTTGTGSATSGIPSPTSGSASGGNLNLGPTSAPTSGRQQPSSRQPTSVPGHSVPPTQPSSVGMPPPPPVTTSTTQGPTYYGMSGIGCPADSSHGVSTIGSGSASGWSTEASGGWNQAGCNGRFSTMPMNGSGTKYDSVNSVTWWFHTGPVVSGSCTVSVYVPNDGTPKHSAGSPALYQVFSGANNQTNVGSFTVQQPSYRGQWTSYSQQWFPTSDGTIGVRLTDEGIDWGSGAGDQLGAASVQVTCRG
ncbi:hypothetical protein KGQ19_08040 [Catenulispora sp. NL8]|uniref:Translation initiation factor IF-2 n=1 Tax=Catenulispora pinistramenti TaxID=2705254 RepID=A0ABS5KLA0_9ACTN|nr:hypothetical protein [Catenulispora pinistramenti]MBS2546817.1 hypothetical protein [Catenulispora pinistramenti]